MNIAEIKYTSNVEEIIRFFYEGQKAIGITTCKYMDDIMNYRPYATVRRISLSRSRRGSEIYISIGDNDCDEMNFEVTMHNGKIYAKGIVLCYNENYAAMMCFAEPLCKNITANMLEYMVTTHEFRFRCKTNRTQLYPNKELYAVDVTIGRDGEYVVLSALPVGTPATGGNELEVIYMEFDEDGFLNSHSIYFDDEDQTVVIADKQKDDEPDEESIEDMVESIIETLTALRNMMSEDKEVLDEFFSQYRRQYYRREQGGK